MTDKEIEAFANKAIEEGQTIFLLTPERSLLNDSADEYGKSLLTRTLCEAIMGIHSVRQLTMNAVDIVRDFERELLKKSN